MQNAEISRTTKETSITATLKKEESVIKIVTGIGFFDHMLTAFATHGGFGITLQCTGDLNVDGHHSVEDCGIVLGQAFREAFGDKSGIQRFGEAMIPMDEALATAVVDICGRGYLGITACFSQARCGDFEVCLCEEFFRAFSTNFGITLHLLLQRGGNAHHEAEALFKALGHALRRATAPHTGILSTKGVL